MLDIPGTIAALILGIVVIVASGAYAVQNFFLLLLFLVISVIATKYRYAEKRVKGLYEHERGWQNVFSNGLMPGICIIGFALTGSHAWLGAFAGSLAAATADKFGSELGVLSGRPISLKNFRHVRPGTSGAISPLGTLMSFIGALLIGTFGWLLYSFDPFIIFTLGTIGFAGGFFDTIIGIAEEEGFGNKSTTNFLCTVVGAICGYLFVYI